MHFLKDGAKIGETIEMSKKKCFSFCTRVQNNPQKAFFSENIWQFGIKAVPLQPQTRKSHRGVEQLVARQAHNLEVARSSRAPATRVVAIR